MTGIGDIIAIAELGYKFAEGLKSYIDAVGAAQESIKALVIEVEQASNYVQGLSQLIEEDKKTAFLMPVGLKECQRLSFAFRETIFEFRTRLLVTNTTENDPEKVAAEFLNLSKWQKWHWPLFKRTLEEPRKRLGELKTDLQLLMVSATAHKLSKMPLTQEVEKKQEDAQAKLKRLTRIKEKAASRHRKEQAKRSTRAPMARSDSPDSPSTTAPSSDSSFSSDDDMLEYFVEFLDAKKQTAELERRKFELYLLNQELEARENAEREKRLLARAEQMEKEAEKQKQKEEAKKEALAELERERTVREQIQQKKAEQKEMIREAMNDAGFDEVKVKEVMDKIEEASGSGVHFDPVQLMESQVAMAEKSQTAGSITSESQAESSSRHSGLRKSLFRWRNSTTSSILSDTAGDEFSGSQKPILEAWSLETPRMRVPLPVATLSKMVKKQDSKSLMKSLGSLPRPCKEEFHDLIEDKTLETSQYLWQLVGIDITKKRIRVGLFSYLEGAMSVLAILQRQESGISETPPGPNFPRRSRGGAMLSPPAPKLPSILKKPTPAAIPEQPKITPSAESRVRISSQSPEIDGTQDSVGDALAEERSRKPFAQKPNLPPLPTFARSNKTKRPMKIQEELLDGDSSYENPFFVGDIQSPRQSRSREWRTSHPRYPGANPFEDDRYGPPLSIRISKDDYHRDPSRMSSYATSQPRSRSRTIVRDRDYYTYMPGAGEHFVPPNASLSPTRERFQPGGPLPPRRYPTLDSLDYRRDFSPDRGAVPNIHTYNNTELYASPRSRSRSPGDFRFFDDDYRRTRRRSRERMREMIRSPPRPVGLRSDSMAYHRSAPSGPPRRFPSDASLRSRGSRSPRRRSSSPDWYDIRYPPRRMFVGDAKGDNQISSSTLPRHTTLSPERGRGENDMALVLRSYFKNEDFDKLKKRANKQARKQSIRRQSVDEHSSDHHHRRPKRGHGQGRKATRKETAESDVLNEYQSMFNPNYEPPVTNDASEDRPSQTNQVNPRVDDFWGFNSMGNLGTATGEGKEEEDDTWGRWELAPSKKEKKKKKKGFEDTEIPPPPPPDHDPEPGNLDFAEADDWGWTFKKEKKKKGKSNSHPPEDNASAVGISENESAAPKRTAAWAISDDESDNAGDLASD